MVCSCWYRITRLIIRMSLGSELPHKTSHLGTMLRKGIIVSQEWTQKQHLYWHVMILHVHEKKDDSPPCIIGQTHQQQHHPSSPPIKCFNQNAFELLLCFYSPLHTTITRCLIGPNRSFQFS